MAFAPAVDQHPKGARARILLSSVFGPYAQDDDFGSRTINPMELYHNQVTRAQGSFSVRRFHRSWGIMMIQKNISAPCTVLDFPTRDAFARELARNRYDVVGISSIIVNVGKAREMCRVVRKLSPHSTIVVAGMSRPSPASSASWTPITSSRARASAGSASSSVTRSMRLSCILRFRPRSGSGSWV